MRSRTYEIVSEYLVTAPETMDEPELAAWLVECGLNATKRFEGAYVVRFYKNGAGPADVVFDGEPGFDADQWYLSGANWHIVALPVD
jgi:hypothetical protein